MDKVHYLHFSVKVGIEVNTMSLLPSFLAFFLFMLLFLPFTLLSLVVDLLTWVSRRHKNGIRSHTTTVLACSSDHMTEGESEREIESGREKLTQRV